MLLRCLLQWVLNILEGASLNMHSIAHGYFFNVPKYFQEVSNHSHSLLFLQSLSSCPAPAVRLYLHIQPAVIHLGMMSFLMTKNYPTSLIQFPQITGILGTFTHYSLGSEMLLRCALVLVCFNSPPLCCCYSSESSLSFILNSI